ncbi:hypothetical protein NSTC745_06377 [Nostoc sp. DSM 114161]|jgi:hypothetical protein|uniref:HNH endonuclease n=1 Tax=Nostoc sp. DSM 114161 TaxID=3440143 RepID=UPI004045C1B8
MIDPTTINPLALPSIVTENQTLNLSQSCVYCNSRCGSELEHFIPRAWGGTDKNSNLLWACSECNLSKSNHHPGKWYKAQPFCCPSRWESILVSTGLTEDEIDALQPTVCPKYVDLSPYWTDDKQLSIQKAKDKTGLDKRTLSAAKKGQLDRGQFETLYKLRDLASELAGRPLSLEEIFRDDD